MAQTPSLTDFLDSPIEQVRLLAPTTAIYTPGGTRRRAVMMGLSPESDEYACWSRAQMFRSIDLFFQLGVQHLFLTMLRPNQFDEIGRYRQRLIDWLEWGLAGPEALEDYARYGWRVRLTGVLLPAALQEIADRLHAVTPTEAKHTVWWYMSPSPGAHWEAMLAFAQQSHARTRSEAIRAMYGEDVPLATMGISFGKPMISPDLMPLLLTDEAQWYWSQRVGFDVDERMLRAIIYDYAYQRRTWRPDKWTRYGDVEQNRAIWDETLVLGLGQRVGNFWYPLMNQQDLGFGDDHTAPYQGSIDEQVQSLGQYISTAGLLHEEYSSTSGRPG